MSKKGFLAVSAAAILPALAAPAIGAEILINHNKALRGGITDGDAPGYPITLSQGGKYRIVSNLLVPHGVNGIEVTVNGVTIDFDGFTMFTNIGTRGVNGILQIPGTFGTSTTTVKNGTISRFQTGILATGAFSVIENMTVLDNTKNGIEVGLGARVNNNTAYGNGLAGIALGNSSIASQNVVSFNANSTSLGSGTANIVCQQRCLIDRNVVTDSPQGLGVFSGPGTMALGNVIAGNKSTGLSSTNGAIGFGDNTLTGNNSGGTQTTGDLLRVHPNACGSASVNCP